MKKKSIHLWPLEALEKGLAEAETMLSLNRISKIYSFAQEIFYLFDTFPEEVKKDVCALASAIFRARFDVEDEAEILAKIFGGRVIRKEVGQTKRAIPMKRHKRKAHN